MIGDVGVGAGIVAGGAALWGAVVLANMPSYTRPRPEPDPVDDLVAVARAAGVYVAADGGRSSGQMAAAIHRHAQTPEGGRQAPPRSWSAGSDSWSPVLRAPATPRPPVHHPCSECGRPICRCWEDEPHGEHDLCTGTVAHGCPHGRVLCDGCLVACEGCRNDLRAQGVLSLYGRGQGWWTT